MEPREKYTENEIFMLQNSLKTLHHTQDLINETSHELLRQSDSLQRTENNVKKISSMAKEADNIVYQISSIWGSFVNLFKSKSTSPKSIQQNLSEMKSDPPSNTSGDILDDINSHLNGIKSVGLALNKELQTQNSTLERISTGITTADTQINTVHSRLKKL